MKLRNLSILLASIFFVASCELTDLDKQFDPNSPTPANLDVNFLYNSIQLNFVSFFVTSSDLTMPITRMMPMTGGNQWNNGWGPQSYSGLWSQAYQGVLINIETMLPAAEERGLVKYMGAAKVFKAYTLMTLVDMFGDVPYTEALQGTSNPSPGRDGQADVYAEAATLLDEAIAHFNDASNNAYPTTDLYGGGSGAQWIRIANSLKMRYYIQTRLVNSNAASGFSSILSGGNFIGADNDDSGSGGDFAFFAGSNRANPNSRHPWYNEAYEASNGRYQSNYYMWLFRGEANSLGFDDPRLRYYFYRQDFDYTNASTWNQFTFDFVDFGDQNNPLIINKPTHYGATMPFGFATNSNLVADADGYYGRDHGNADGIPPDGQIRTTFGVYPAGGQIDAADPASPSTFSHVQRNGTRGATGQGVAPILMKSSVYFMRAEAALTMGTGEDARALFEQGVRESINFVQGFADERGQAYTGTDITNTDTYVGTLMTDYDNAADKLAVVTKEWHKALWGNGLDAYNMYRRTGYPAGLQPTRDQADAGQFPRSVWYPSNYVNLNQNSEQKADLGQAIFWDNNTSAPE